MKKLWIMLLLCFGLVVPELSMAADARDYIPAPPGTFLFCTYFRHITASNLYKNGHKVSNDFNLSQNIGIFRPVYYTSIANKALYGSGPFTIDPQALIPFGEAHLDGSIGGATLPDSSDSGFADPVLLTTFWFVNAPEKKLWVGFTPYLTLPLGTYDRQKVLNLGGNRWVVRPEIGVVKGIGDRAYLDLVLNGEFYTDNDDYGPNGVKLEQDPVLGFEAHASYDITKQWFVSLDYYYNNGGETKIAGVSQNDELSNHGIGISFFWGIGDHNQLLLQYRDDFSVESGPGTNTFGARWAYFF